MLLSVNKCSIFALTVPIYQSNGIGETSNFSSKFQVDFIVRHPFRFALTVILCRTYGVSSLKFLSRKKVLFHHFGYILLHLLPLSWRLL